MVLFSSRTYIEIIVRTQHGDEFAKRNEHFILYESDKDISFISRRNRWLPCFGVVYVLFAHRKRYKMERRCADYKRHKKVRKTSKIVLTNGDSGGNITKLSRETRVKTK